jgi:3-oxoacyl-[acyl-carrier protein] reductase
MMEKRPVCGYRSVMLQIDLSGKTALITGASGQLGRVMARTLAMSGAELILHYHQDEANAKRVERDIVALGRRALLVQSDVGTEAGVRAIAEAARAGMGAPDIVVINAVAQIHPWSTVLEESLEDYTSQFRTCVLQAVLLAKAFVPALIQKGWGRIIGINTECAMQMFETHSAYAAGKRGMDGVLRVLAREIGRHGITVNQVAPGWTISDRDRERPADDAGYRAAIPLRRRGTDQEIANVVAFLASDLASFVHGAFVPVCGGNVMPTI